VVSYLLLFSSNNRDRYGRVGDDKDAKHGDTFSGWMEVNASRILKIEKKNGGRTGRCQVEEGFLELRKEGGCCPWVGGVNWQRQSSQSELFLKEAVPLA
jgi:hypothetical protein